MLSNLQILNLQPQVCLRDRDNAYKPINLYHKVGHGKLDMYVINPSRDAKEIREFMERWNGENSKTLGECLPQDMGAFKNYVENQGVEGGLVKCPHYLISPTN